MALADSHRVAGRIAEAELVLRQLLEALPDYHPAYHLLGLTAAGGGNLPLAIELIARALSLDDSVALYHRSMGELCRRSGRLEMAAQALRRSLDIDPAQPRAYFNLGEILVGLKRFPAALDCYNQLVTFYPDNANAHFQRALILAELKHFGPALAGIDQALSLKLDYPEVFSKRAGMLAVLGRYDEALASYDRALALKPDFLEGCVNRGMLLQQMHRYDEALNSFDRAIALAPDFAPAHLNKALLTLALGDQEQGWRMYEWRWKCANENQLRKFIEPPWRGQESISGKTLLIWGEAGLGDILQFCRFVPMLEALGARVVLEVPPPLVSVLQTMSRGDLQVVPRGQLLPSCDMQCPIMSLPFAFGTTLATLPATMPYLHADVVRQAAWRQRLGNKTRPRVGIVWSGRAGAEMDFNPCRCRSLPLAMLGPLLQLPLEFHCLQKEVHPHDAAALAGFPRLHLHQAELHDFAETAALIEEMDLVVSIDTSIVHLAGALGKPLWVMLPYSTDFRWTLDQNTTPWYPAAKLFRQSRVGDWSAVVAEVAQQLGDHDF